MSVKTIRDIYRKLRPKLIVCDFDGTATTTETITPLIALAKKHWKKQELFDGISEQSNWYNTNHKIFEKDLLINLDKYKNQLLQNEIKWNINDLIPLFEKCDNLDFESVNKLDLNGEYLANIELHELSNIFKDYIRNDLIDVLRECLDDNCIVKILSHNWSSYTIYHALNCVIRQDNIICNEMQQNNYNITTGKLLRKCVTSYVDSFAHA